MWFQTVFQLAGMSKPAEAALVFNYAVMFIYMVALHYAGELV